MLSKSMDVVILKGEFIRDTPVLGIYPDIEVQEYKGNMIYLMGKDNKLLNIQKDGDVINLTNHIVKYINSEVNYIEINAIKCSKLEDIVNPVVISKRWESSNSDIKLHKIIRCDSGDEASISNRINRLSFFAGKNMIYMEIYVHYK